MVATPNEVAPTDEQLAEVIARRGEGAPAMAAAQDAFDVLYGRHAGPLLAFLGGRCRRSQVEDAHQDVWKRAWQHLPKSFHGGQFRAWLFRIARNQLIDASRKKHPDLLDDQPIADDRQPRPDDWLLDKERRETLEGCLDRLDPQSASVVRERLGGSDYREIQLALEIPPPKAQKLYHTAWIKLSLCVERALR